jgi:hypothetical protein
VENEDIDSKVALPTLFACFTPAATVQRLTSARDICRVRAVCSRRFAKSNHSSTLAFGLTQLATCHHQSSSTLVLLRVENFHLVLVSANRLAVRNADDDHFEERLPLRHFLPLLQRRRRKRSLFHTKTFVRNRCLLI